jgi:hypothetical protein
MRKGRLLSPDEVRQGQVVFVVPSGPDVHRGAGLGAYAEGEARVSDALHGAARRGAVHLYELPEPEPTPAPAPAAPEEP